MGLVVWQQLEGRQFDTPVGELQVPSCLCLWESCLQLSVLQCLMGLVVLQQLVGHGCPPLP
ncbi:unnamed protein product [Staurois parvus]|uniref:Uncharacterized protein n=1 Tax=Staurois parvus TaxID=386267 RepID=A0ABN9EL55_9NEOB|nr:unnamed protein product [Staurois parvus]